MAQGIEKRRPLLTVRGREGFLSVWVTGNAIKFSVSRRAGEAFERVDAFVVPLDYMFLQLFGDREVRETARRCILLAEAAERLAEEEEKSE